MEKSLFWAAIFLALFASGCQEKIDSASLKSEAASPEVKATGVAVSPLDPATAATVKGVVFFDGAVPPAKKISMRGSPECAALHAGGEVDSEELVVNQDKLQNVFVYIKEGLERRTFPAPLEPVTIVNKGCLYAPHVVGVQVGQPVIFLNNDATLHNIHSYSKGSAPFNLGLPFQGMKQTKKFSAPEVMVSLKCDVHPWMTAFIGVLPHPYFQVTNEEGSFELKNLPPGEYVIEAWHEKLGTRSQKISIGPQETEQIEFRFSA